MASENKSFSVAKEGELRFEVEEGWLAKVQVTQGNAEIFGVPCVLNETYELDSGKFAVFTWYGCEVTLTGVPRPGRVTGNSPLVSAYVTEDQNLSMLAVVNVHGRLEQMREEAMTKQTRGPVCLIAGPSDSGKSTLARILSCYAARRGKRPIAVELDCGQNGIAVPGTVGAVPVDIDSISVEEGLSSANALVYFYGYASPAEAPEHYKKCVDRLAQTIEQRFAIDPASNASGCIVNTCGWVEGEGFNLLVHAIQSFRADVVLVLGQDLLNNKLKKALPESTLVIKLPVSGGATERNREFRKRSRDRRVREYFYGPRVGGPGLSPSVQEVDFDSLSILRIPTKEDTADEAIRPIGKASAMDPNRARPVELSTDLQHAVLAVSHAGSEEEVLQRNVAGFVHVQSVDMEQRKVTLLCPQRGALPGELLLMGGIKYVDSGSAA